MALLFRCPHCGTETEVDDCYAGQTGPCVQCRGSITVPYPSNQHDVVSGNGAGGVSGNGGPGQPAARRRSSMGVVLGLAVFGIVGGMLVIGAAVAIFAPAVTRARSAAVTNSCASNLRRIASAMHQYAADHGRFPPAYVADKDGKPMHSWRVLLLPYLGRQDVYSQYDFSQPWDSPQNMVLAMYTPEVYLCPADPNSRGAQETNYMVVVGDRTLFPATTASRLVDASDGLTETILVVETPGKGVCWLDPTDLQFDSLDMRINQGLIGLDHKGGANVVTADGEVHQLSEDTPPEYLRALLTRDGGEVIPWEQFER